MIILYVLKSAVVLAVLYAVFFFTLQRETFHRFNRCVILAIVVLSAILPSLHLAVNGSMPLVGSVSRMIDGMIVLDGIAVSANGRVGMSAADGLSVLEWVQVAYLLGVVFMTLRLAVQAELLVRNLSSGARCSDGCGNTVVLKSCDVPPYSIFRYIVMSVGDYEHNRRSILTHEREHIRLGHTYDKLLMEAAKVVQWFNPAVWLIARDLDALHEYEADEAVIRKGIDAKTYQTLLVVKAVGNRLQPFANNLNRGSLKRRIIMMNQKKSSRWMMLKALFIVPAAVAAVSAFAVENIPAEQPAADIAVGQPRQQSKNTVQVKKTVARKPAANAVSGSASAAPQQVVGKRVAASCKAGGTVYDVAEVMPQYPGGQAGLIDYLGSNVKYPASAKAAKKEGRTAVKFIVDTDGSISDVEVLQSAGDKDLDAEAVRVVKSMPKWTPGTVGGQPVRVRNIVPFEFSLK